MNDKNPFEQAKPPFNLHPTPNSILLHSVDGIHLMDWIIRKSALHLFLDLQHHHLRHSRSLYLCTGHHPFDGWNYVVQHPSLLLVGRNFLIILGKCRPTPFTSFGGILYSRTSISPNEFKKKNLQWIYCALQGRLNSFEDIFSEWSMEKVLTSRYA